MLGASFADKAAAEFWEEDDTTMPANCYDLVKDFCYVRGIAPEISERALGVV